VIALCELALRVGGRVLFSGVDLTVHAGWRVGVVGRNGSGKTVWVLLTAQPDEGREPTGRSVPLELFAPPDDIDADPDEGVWACLTRPAA